LRGRWRQSIGFRAENVRVEDLDLDAPQEIIDVEGYTALFGVKLGIGDTAVDNRYKPSKGYVVSADYERVTGDDDFGVLGGTYIRYFTMHEDVLGRKTVLAAKVQAATNFGEDAPPFEKFYAGGTGLYGLRGFEYRGVSTRGLQTNVPFPEYKDPVGSDWVFLASTELTVPLTSENFEALFFVDSGTVDTGSYRLSVGTGVQIMVPQVFGDVPMRFEIAAPLLKDDEDETQVFSFSAAGLFR
jgi:outer membrane protein assembly factor BamA